MEFHEKMQQLRKQKGWTQEELAERLFVSRTAVSKWESGRGYPGIESLKAVSKLFLVSVDELLSGDELISLAQAEQKEKAGGMRSLVFGILDCMTALLIFLPFFGQQDGDMIRMVPLLSLTESMDYILFIYIAAVALISVFGVAQLALQNWHNPVWIRGKTTASIVLGVALLLFSIAARHPYPGAFLLCLLVLKGVLLLKQP